MIYQIQDTQTGQIHEIEGPEDATPEEIEAEADRLLGSAQPPQQEAPVDFNVRTAISNIPSSGAAFLDNIAGAVMHPQETIPNIAEVLLSGAGHVGKAFGADIEDRVLKPGQDFMSVMKERYGSSDKLKKTAMEDPVGVAADLAGLLTGVGGGLKMAGMRTAGRVASAAGNLVDPLATAGRVGRFVGKAATNLPGVSGLPEYLYRAGTQFDDPKLIAAAMERGIDPSLGTAPIEKLRNKQGRIIGDEVRKSTAEFNPVDVLNGMEEAKQRLFASPGIDFTKESRAFDRVVDDLHNQLGVTPAVTITSPIMGPNGNPISTYHAAFARSTLPVEDLQRFKVDANNRLEKLFGSEKPPTGALAAKNHARYNAKQMLDAALSPEYRAANKEFGTLDSIVDATKNVENAIKVGDTRLSDAANRAMYRAGAVAGAFGTYAWPAAYAAAAGANKLLRSPSRQIRAGLTLHNLRDASLPELMGAKFTTAGPLADVLNRIEEERIRKLRARLSAR